jgi:methylmalonyl-CoA mutase
VKQNRLFEQFPPVSKQEWIDKIVADLKGSDFSRKMVWKTGEGFDVMPFYMREDLQKLNHVNCIVPLLLSEGEKSGKKGYNGSSAGKANSWLVRQNIRVADYSEANRAARSLLTKGVDSLGFIIGDPLKINPENFSILLDEINPGETEINFISEGKAREIIAILTGIYEGDKPRLSVLRGAIEADPLGRLLMNGTLCIPVEAGMDYLAELTRDSLKLPLYRNIHINGSTFTDAGAGPVMELAFTLSMAVEYLTQLTSRGISPGDAASRIRFSFGTGSDYFMEIAKLRAARLLWAVVAKGYGAVNDSRFRMEMHCVTSRWNSTILDPYVNLLRTQTEAMSAVLGGTDSLTVNPFDGAFKEAGEFTERIARNQQLILREEAFFDRVADPSAGSYYIENLTALVAENAWKLFLELEEEGGFLSSLCKGHIQGELKKTAEERKRAVSGRKEILLGTNLYPDPEEKPDPVYKAEEAKGQAVKTGELICEPVSLGRGAEEIEKLRMAVGNAPSRPTVFLLQAGDKLMRRARSQFSAAFFGCAGYRIIDNDGYDDLEKGIEQALESGAGIVVLCSSDDEYPVLAPAVHERTLGKAVLVIAGNPPSMESLREKGILNYISIRSDLVETLRHYNTLSGIAD